MDNSLRGRGITQQDGISPVDLMRRFVVQSGIIDLGQEMVNKEIFVSNLRRLYDLSLNEGPTNGENSIGQKFVVGQRNFELENKFWNEIFFF